MNQWITKYRVTHHLALMVRIALGLIFIYAGLVKLGDPKAFARTISEYNLVPEALLPVAAIGLPALEVLAGAGLLLAVPGSLSLVSGLLILFAAVLWYGILKDLQIDCGCFSVEELKSQEGLRQAFYRDLALMGGAFTLYIARWRQNGCEPGSAHWAKLLKIL